MPTHNKRIPERKIESSPPSFAILLFCIAILAIVVTFYPGELDTKLPRDYYAMQLVSEGPDITSLFYFANYSEGNQVQKIFVNSTGNGRIVASFGGFYEVLGPQGSECNEIDEENVCTYYSTEAEAIFTITGNNNPNARYTFSAGEPVDFSAMMVLGEDYVCNSPCVDSYDPEIAIIHEPFPSNTVFAHNVYKREDLSMDTVSISLFLSDNKKVQENANRQTTRELIFIPVVVGVILLFLEYVIMNKIFVRFYHWMKQHVMKMLGKEK
ncbi:MAG: hypothetical protein ABIJ34_02280 [archaeon]